MHPRNEGTGFRARVWCLRGLVLRGWCLTGFWMFRLWGVQDLRFWDQGPDDWMIRLPLQLGLLDSTDFRVFRVLEGSGSGSMVQQQQQQQQQQQSQSSCCCWWRRRWWWWWRRWRWCWAGAGAHGLGRLLLHSLMCDYLVAGFLTSML